MIRRAFLPSLYDLYQMLIAVIGMVAINRVLFELNWSLSIKYGAATVLAYWVGQGLASFIQMPPKTSLD